MIRCGDEVLPSVGGKICFSRALFHLLPPAMTHVHRQSSGRERGRVGNGDHDRASNRKLVVVRRIAPSFNPPVQCCNCNAIDRPFFPSPSSHLLGTDAHSFLHIHFFLVSAPADRHGCVSYEDRWARGMDGVIGVNVTRKLYAHACVVCWPLALPLPPRRQVHARQSAMSSWQYANNAAILHPKSHKLHCHDRSILSTVFFRRQF